MTSPAALEVTEVHSGYGTGQVVHGVSLQVSHGGVTALLGLNGAGKTALLRAVVGLAPADRGTLRLFGRDVTGLAAHQRQRLGLGTAIGHGVFESLTVVEHLALAARTRRRDDPRVGAVLDSFPVLARRARQRAATMSGGERQMLSLARALVTQPRLLVLDEPSAGLAPAVTDGLYAALRRWRADHATAVLIAEQQPRWVVGFADDVVIMAAGTLVARRAADEWGEDVDGTTWWDTSQVPGGQAPGGQAAGGPAPGDQMPEGQVADGTVPS